MTKILRNLLLIIILFSFSNLNTYSAVSQDSLGRNLWYIEMGGDNIPLSFNYEFIISKNYLYFDNINFRTGIGGIFFSFFYQHVGSPLMIEFIFGKKYCIDLGIGILLDYAPKLYGWDYPTQAVKFIGNFGYRFIGDGGFIFRASFTPIYSANQGIIPFLGISLGSYF